MISNLQRPQKLKSRKNQRAKTDSTYYGSPFCIAQAIWIFIRDDFQDRPSDAKNTKNNEIDPSKLFDKAMTKGNEESDESQGNVSDEFEDCNSFSGGSHPI